jgi:hypothetical protein
MSNDITIPLVEHQQEESVHVTLPPKTQEAVKKHERHPYWLGLSPDCPFEVVHVAGLEFPKTIMPSVEVEGEDEAVRQIRKGQIHRLTAEQVEKIKGAVIKKFIRPAGKGRAFMVTMDSYRYHPEPTDIPVARYCYMARLPDDVDLAWRPAKLPPVMLKEEKKA